MKTPLSSKAFTLIELLVVIAVISLLSSIVYASVSSARQEAAVAKTSTQAREIKNSVALAQDTLLAGVSTSSTLTNTNPNVGLSQKPELAKTIFPQFESLNSNPPKPNIPSELERALPKVSKLVSGTEEDDDYVYVSNGSQACVTEYPHADNYLSNGEDRTFNDGCAPIRCGPMGDAAESIVMYKLDTSDYYYSNVADTPGYDINKVVHILKKTIYYGDEEVYENWAPYPPLLFTEGDSGEIESFLMMCQ